MPKGNAKRNKLNILISDPAKAWYEANFATGSTGTAYALEAFYGLCRNELARTLMGKFTGGELCLMIDVSNGLMLMPHISGQHMYAQVSDGCALDHLDEKWAIHKNELLAKLDSLQLTSLIALEIWCRAFWEGNRKGQDEGIKTDLEEYVKQLGATTTHLDYIF